MKPNLIVTVTGGRHSGKSELANTIVKCAAPGDIDSLPAGQVAEEAATTLWNILNTK